MNFEQLKCLIAAVEEPTFLDAAETLHITQSSLSKQIRKLESELDLTLIDRSHRKASLTEAGEIFYREALVLVRQYERMLSRMDACRSSGETLRIGTLPVLSQYGLTARLKAFRDRHSDARIVLEEAEEQELLKGIRRGTYDLIIVREELVPGDDFQTWFLAADELAAVLPARHPAAPGLPENPLSCTAAYVKSSSDTEPSINVSPDSCDSVRSLCLKQISDEPFILMHRYTSVYRLCMKEFARQGIEPEILRTARVETIISSVAEGEAVSLIPKSNLELFRHPGILSFPLDPPVSLNLVLAGSRKEKRTPLEQELIRFLSGSPS